MIHTSQFDYELILSRKPAKKLMIVLHGRGDSLRPFRRFDEELKVPGLNYLLLNAPRKYDTGFTWYGFPPNQGPGVLKARKKLMLMMKELEAQGWASSDIFFLGFSQGALISSDFIQRFSKPLAGVICISGYVYFFKNWRREIVRQAYKTPWLMTHGNQDDALELEETRRDHARLTTAGLKPQWVEFKKGHEIEARKEIPYLRSWILKRM